MVDFFAAFREIGKGMIPMLWYMLFLIPVIVLVIVLIVVFRNKAIFRYPVRIFKVRESGKVKEQNTTGGYINRKGSAPFFRIKIGKLKHMDLTTTPNPEYMDEDDRVYYKQIDINTLVQMKRTFDNPKGISYSPVESDVKYGAILSINRIREIVGQSEKWKTIVSWAALFFVGFVLLAGYAILLNSKCPNVAG